VKDIAVEKGLSNVSNYLKSNGYQVHEIDFGKKNDRDQIDNFDAVVLSGMNNDFVGIENTLTKAPVIIASGLRPEDIKAQIESVKM